MYKYRTSSNTLSPTFIRSVGDLDNSGTSGDGLVSHGGVAAGQHDIALAVDGSSVGRRLRHGYREATRDWGSLGEDWAGDSDEGSIDLRLAVSGLEGVAGSQKSDGGASGDFLRVGRRRHQLGESLYAC